MSIEHPLSSCRTVTRRTPSSLVAVLLPAPAPLDELRLLDDADTLLRDEDDLRDEL